MVMAEPTETRPPRCTKCGQELTEVSEKNLSKHYNWVQGKYHEVETSYASSEIECTKCGKKLTMEQRNFVTDHL